MDGYSILHTLEVLAFKEECKGIILAFLSVESKIGHEVYTVPTCLLRPWYATSSTDQSPTFSKIQPFFQ